MRKSAVAATAVLMLSGCNVGPDFHPPRWVSPSSWFSGEPGPAQPVRSEPVAVPIDVSWWRLFRDPKLTLLERRVAAGNLDVQAATSRLLEARAQLGITRAGLYPSINANGSYEYTKASNKGEIALLAAPPGTTVAPGSEANGAFGFAAGGVTTPANLPPVSIYQYGLQASWEPDFWGRVRRAVESADASLQASADARRAVLLTSLSEAAQDYIQLRGTQEQLRIARENLGTSQQGLKLTQERAAAGVTTDLDVANASAQVRTTAAQIPALEAQERELMNALALLSGQPPNTLVSELAVPRPVPPVPPRVPVGFPSELARRRPDIRQAEANLHAATADVGVAIADFYPSVTLTASFGLQALQPSNLVNWGARQYSMGPGINLPIFEGGQLRETLRLRKAQQREAATNYQRTVLTAWHDVANALIALQNEQRRRQQLVQAVADNRRALALAQSRYEQGVSDFLQVLVVQQNVLAAEQALATSNTNVSADVVALYRALGGGWEQFYPANR